jgi:hypothetical protein
MQPPPVIEQLSLVETRPLDDEGQDSRRQVAAQEADWVDANLRFGPCVGRVEMGRFSTINIEDRHLPFARSARPATLPGRAHGRPFVENRPAPELAHRLLRQQ